MENTTDEQVLEDAAHAHDAMLQLRISEDAVKAHQEETVTAMRQANLRMEFFMAVDVAEQVQKVWRTDVPQVSWCNEQRAKEITATESAEYFAVQAVGVQSQVQLEHLNWYIRSQTADYDNVDGGEGQARIDTAYDPLLGTITYEVEDESVEGGKRRLLKDYFVGFSLEELCAYSKNELPTVGPVRTVLIAPEHLHASQDVIPALLRTYNQRTREVKLRISGPAQVGEWRLVACEQLDWAARDTAIPGDVCHWTKTLQTVHRRGPDGLIDDIPERLLVVPRFDGGSDDRPPLGILPLYPGALPQYPVQWLSVELQRLLPEALRKSGLTPIYSCDPDNSSTLHITRSVRMAILTGETSEALESTLLNCLIGQRQYLNAIHTWYSQLEEYLEASSDFDQSASAPTIDDHLLLLWKAIGLDFGVDWTAKCRAIQIGGRPLV